MLVLTLEIIVAVLALAFLALLICAIVWLFVLLRVSKALQKETNSLILDARQLKTDIKERGDGATEKFSLFKRFFKKVFLRWLTS